MCEIELAFIIMVDRDPDEAYDIAQLDE